MATCAGFSFLLAVAGAFLRGFDSCGGILSILEMINIYRKVVILCKKTQ